MRSIPQSLYPQKVYSRQKSSHNVSQHNQSQSKISQRVSTQQYVINKSILNHVNSQIQKMINFDEHDLEYHLRNMFNQLKNVVNQELFQIKYFNRVQFGMYFFITKYIKEKSINTQLKQYIQQIDQQQHINNKYQDQQHKHRNSQHKHRNSQQKYQNQQHKYQHQQDKYQYQQTRRRQNQQMQQQLKSIKSTVPIIPKNRSTQKSQFHIKLNKTIQLKLQQTKQNLQTILQKIQGYGNSRLSGQDIIKLKKSYFNILQLKPTQFIPNLIHRPSIQDQIKQIKNLHQQNILNSTVKYSSRSNSKSKTFVNDRNKEQDQTNQLLIQQLHSIIQKKESRIKELTKQLSKSLKDRKQLQSTIETIQLDLQLIQKQKRTKLQQIQKQNRTNRQQVQKQNRKNQQIIQTLNQDNLNLKLQLKDLKQAEQIRKVTQHQRPQGQQNQTYNYLKAIQKRQKIYKLSLCIKQISQQIIPPLKYQQSCQSNSKWKQPSQNIFNDISQITPKRSTKQDFSSYIQQTNQATVRKNQIMLPLVFNQTNIRKQKSLSKIQILNGNRSLAKLNIPKPEEFRDAQRQAFQRFLLLQAITIEEIIDHL